MVRCGARERLLCVTGVGPESRAWGAKELGRGGEQDRAPINRPAGPKEGPRAARGGLAHSPFLLLPCPAAPHARQPVPHAPSLTVETVASPV